MKKKHRPANLVLLKRSPAEEGRAAAQARLEAAERHAAQLKRLADRIEALATDAARNDELVDLEAQTLVALVVAIRVRAIKLVALDARMPPSKPKKGK